MTAIRLHYSAKVFHPMASVEQMVGLPYTVRENRKVHLSFKKPGNFVWKHPDGRTFLATKRTFKLAKQYRQIRPYLYTGRFPMVALVGRIIKENVQDFRNWVSRYVGR